MGLPQADFGYRIATNQYGHFCLPEAYLHREVPKRLLQGKVYEPATLQLIRRKAGSGDVVSGGAFVGDFFPAISEALADGALLHSFEPNPISHRAAEVTIALNGLNNLRLSEKAVGNSPGRQVLQTERRDGSAIAAAARINPDLSGDDPRGIPVDVVTLDTLVPADRQVSVLHLDLEGFEVPALEGAARILRDHAPFVVLEGTRSRRQQTYLEALNRLTGSVCYHLVGTMERNSFFKAL